MRMNSKEFKKALDNIVKEKNIDPEVVYSAMELALTSAYKKNFNSKTNVKVLFDRETGEIKVYSYLTVVPDDKMTKEEWYAQLFEHLGNSKFRSSFHLKQKDIDYINAKGLNTIREHARDFIAKREAPAVIPNDGKQTPTKGHPVFIAQHATATCCRECIRKWHKIQPGRNLSPIQQEYLVDVIMTWIQRELDRYGAER